ncbi:MAG: aminoacyl-tRNA hydrolase, partial [Patescibacteria group bacterium]
MKLIVGLGNPGKEYARTFHNAGFMAVEELSALLQKDTRTSFFGEKRQRSYEGEEFWFKHQEREREKIILQKPLTYMNESGQAVIAVVNRYKAKIDCAHDVWIIHDDGDIALGTVRFDVGKRAAGHRGVQSIHDALGMPSSVRIRIGIR